MADAEIILKECSMCGTRDVYFICPKCLEPVFDYIPDDLFPESLETYPDVAIRSQRRLVYPSDFVWSLLCTFLLLPVAEHFDNRENEKVQTLWESWFDFSEWPIRFVIGILVALFLSLPRLKQRSSVAELRSRYRAGGHYLKYVKGQSISGPANTESGSVVIPLAEIDFSLSYFKPTVPDPDLWFVSRTKEDVIWVHVPSYEVRQLKELVYHITLGSQQFQAACNQASG